MINLIYEIKKIFINRQIIWNLAINQIKAKYRYPVLGIMWSMLTPLFLSVIFLIAFGIIMKIKTTEYPFLVYFLSGMFPWIYFSASVLEACNSVVQNNNLIKSVAFYRQNIPLSCILVNLINFFFNLPVLFIFILIFKIKISLYIILLPFVLMLHTLLIIGISLIVSSLQVRIRDTRYILELLVNAIFFITPIFYPLNMIKEISSDFLKIYMFNPMASIITLYRITILEGYTRYLPVEVNYFNLIIFPLILTFLLLYLGFFIFNKLEPSFADFI